MSAKMTSVAAQPRLGLVGLTPTTTVYLAVAAAAIGAYFLLRDATQQVAFEVIGTAAVAAAAVGVFRTERVARLPWIFITLGLAAQVTGDWIDTWYELVDHREASVPSVIDGVYLFGYSSWIAGLLVAVYLLRVVRQLAALLDTLVFLVAFSTVQWIVVLDGVRHEGYSVGETIVDMVYPSLDVVLLVLVLQLTVRPTHHAMRVRLLTIAVVAMVAADEFFFVDANYTSGSWINALWLLSYVFFGAAGLQPSGAPGTGDDTERPAIKRIRVILLAAALLLIPLTLLGEFALHHGRLHPLAAAIGMTLVSAFVFARLWLLLRDSERQNHELRELDFLKDEFVASVSHELRTPLTSIAGYTELLEEDGVIAAETSSHGHLEVIRRSTNRLLGVVDDLLFAASVQRGALSLAAAEIELGEITHLAVDAARPAADAKEIDLQTQMEPGVSVPADASRLGQVLDNLIANALKFTPQGGSVSIRVWKAPDAAYVEISDTGPGIPADELARVFDRFYRSSGAITSGISGTGLGLYIVQTIVEAHGGSVSAANLIGGGARFRIALPRVGAR